MPIYEYACNDCGQQFEKLVRHMTGNGHANTVECPSCGQEHVTQQPSTFAAHNGGSRSEAAPSCNAGYPSTGCCGGGMCGSNFN